MPTATQAIEALRQSLAEDDPAFFIDTYCVTYDPRKTPAQMPFKLYPRQRAFIAWLHARYEGHEDCLVEKSRDMGVTWLCLAYAVWLWLFKPGVKIGFGSRKEILVDRLGDADSIFEKIRMLLRYPKIRPLLPSGFSIDEHAGYLKIINPANGASITGEAGDQIGRGGRNSIYFKDESAFYERPERIEAALSQNSDCKVDVSTPNGVGNPFYRKRHSGMFPVFTFHWRDDPRKDGAWYAKQKTLLDSVIVAQEIDIDYTASVEDICIPAAWVQAAVGRPCKASARGIAGLDVGGGRDKSVLVARHGPSVVLADSWGDGDTTRTAHRAIAGMLRCRCSTLCFDSIGVGAGVASTLMHNGQAAHGINVGQPPSDIKWDDEKTSKEKFANLKAELWWILRDRFRKTWEAASGMAQHPEGEMISLPADAHELIQQLSLPKFEISSSGKIAIESKKALARRGVKSPDHAEALVLTFALEAQPAQGTAHQMARTAMAELF